MSRADIADLMYVYGLGFLFCALGCSVIAGLPMLFVWAATH